MGHRPLDQDPLALVRAAFEAFARRDAEGVLPLLDPEVEIRSLMTQAERTTYRGHAGAVEWLRAVFDVFPDWNPVPVHSEERGGDVITAFDVTATASMSGVRIEQRYWQGARVRDGRLTWFGFFRSEADALAALANS